MKDLTHYFSSPPKSCESSPASSSTENVKEAKGAEKKNTETASPRKRSRVKIKISSKDSKSRVCDIIDSKIDLIDKTPSPFNGNTSKRAVQENDSPKSALSKNQTATKLFLDKQIVKNGSKTREVDENETGKESTVSQSREKNSTSKDTKQKKSDTRQNNNKKSVSRTDTVKKSDISEEAIIEDDDSDELMPKQRSSKKSKVQKNTTKKSVKEEDAEKKALAKETKNTSPIINTEKKQTPENEQTEQLFPKQKAKKTNAKESAKKKTVTKESKINSFPKTDSTEQLEADNEIPDDDETKKHSNNQKIERDEPDAFKLLMTKCKPLRYNPLPLLSTEAAEHEKKQKEENKAKLKRNKEKLSALADEKGYSKRMLEEMEEGEKIERRLENRAKVFRIDSKDESTNSGQKQTPRGLLNYFSKATPEQKQKDVMTLTTIVVKADVHVSDSLVETDVNKSICKIAPKTNGNKKQISRAILSVVDDIQVIRSESLSPPPVPKHGHFLTPKPCKPKWSMRVKLQSYSDDETITGTDFLNNDDIFSPKKHKTKFRSRKSNEKVSDDPEAEEKKSHKHKKKQNNEHEELLCMKKHDMKQKTQNSIDPDSTTVCQLGAKTEILHELQNESTTQKKPRRKPNLSPSNNSENGEPEKQVKHRKNRQCEETESEDKRNTRSRLSLNRKSKDNKNNQNIYCNHSEDPIILLTDDGFSEDTNIIHVEEDHLIDSDRETVSVKFPSSKRKPQEKLAPLFVKRLKPDPAAMAARRGFLTSGVPENVKKVMERKPSCSEIGNSVLPFPEISHVLQADTQSNPDESFVNHDCLKMKIHGKYHPSLDVTQLKCVIDLGNLQSTAQISKKEDQSQMEKANIEDILTEIGKHCSDARTIWQTIAETKNSSVTKTDKRKGRKRKSRSLGVGEHSEFKGNLESETINPTWTCKYKPKSAAETVGNEAGAEKLRSWLDGWKLPSKKDDDNDEDGSSGDEFYSSDCSFSSSNESNQVAVLLGPHGSGKTASVYAVAEELGYRVLEVNASSRRTGKKILLDFQEATKSHRVKKSHQPALIPAPQKSLQKKVPQNSLILIEDVDLIFDEDEGFVSSMFQLATHTKRPIVMTCSENCSHLSKLAPHQLLIHYQAAVGERVSALLELISLAESGCRLPPSCLEVLLKDGDLRKALLQLQYLLLSGPPSNMPQIPLPSHTTIWSDTKTNLYKPALKLTKKLKKQQLESANKSVVDEENTNLLKSLAENLDSVSLISSLAEVDDPAPPSWLPKLNPSLSLSEDDSPYSSSAVLGPEIATWLHQMTLGCTTKSGTSSDARNAAMKRHLRLGVDRALSQVIPSSLEHRPASVDYLPVIRTICRTEEERMASNTKRGNRFHHYLRTLDMPYTSTKPNILAAACTVMQEKLDKR